MTNPKFLNNIIAFILTILAVALSSCEFEIDNKGYPKAISFSAEGGTIIAKGDDFFGGLRITVDEQTFSTPICDELNPMVTYSVAWLTVTLEYQKNQLIFKADSATEGEPKIIKIEGNFWNDVTTIAEITVKRKH